MGFKSWTGLFAVVIAIAVSCTGKNSAEKKTEKEKDCKVKFPTNFNTFSKPMLKWLDSAFTDKLTHQKFNGVYAFYYNDSLFSGSMGVCSPTNKTLPGLNDVFQLASSSKPFLGIVLMQLIAEKKIKLTDTFSHYFPSFPYKQITLKHLMTHTSGLPEYHFYMEKKGRKTDSLLSPQFVYENIDTNTTPLYFKPGKEFDYCNTNYALLARLVSKIENKDWETILNERIIKKIGMDSTHFYNPAKRKTGAYKVQGMYGRTHVYDEYMLNAIPGDKGVYASVNDLLKLNLALNANCLLDSATKALMFTPQVPYERGKFYYAFGWRMIKIKGHWWAFHNGWWKGYRAHFWRCLDAKVCFVLLSNYASYGSVNCVKIASSIPFIQPQKP